MNRDQQHARQARVLRLRALNYTIRQIADATGYGRRHVKRLIADARREFEARKEAG